MKDFIRLYEILSQSIPMNKARMTCMVMLIIAIIDAQSCNLKKIARRFPCGQRTDSSYRRIQRFMACAPINYDQLAKFIFKLFSLDKVVLSIDRTNWKFGKKNVNIFMLAVVYKGIAIPLYWDMLDKRGNSNALERIALIERFIQTFGKDRIQYVLADREFIGNQWFKWLDKAQIAFCIRIKKQQNPQSLWARCASAHVAA